MASASSVCRLPLWTVSSRFSSSVCGATLTTFPSLSLKTGKTFKQEPQWPLTVPPRLLLNLSLHTWGFWKMLFYLVAAPTSLSLPHLSTQAYVGAPFCHSHFMPFPGNSLLFLLELKRCHLGCHPLDLLLGILPCYLAYLKSVLRGGDRNSVWLSWGLLRHRTALCHLVSMLQGRALHWIHLGGNGWEASPENQTRLLWSTLLTIIFTLYSIMKNYSRESS